MPHYSHQSYAMVIQARGINKSLLGPYHGDAYPRKCKVTKKRRYTTAYRPLFHADSHTLLMLRTE